MIRKARPIWQELPNHFKTDVVKILDFKSRCCLKICSESDQILVKSCSNNFKTVVISPPDKLELDDKIYSCSGIDQLISLVIHIFEHPKSFAKAMEFNSDRRNEPENVQFFLETFLRRLKANMKNIKFKCRTFNYQEYHNRILEDHFLQVLQLFDPKYLTEINLSSAISPDFIEEVCASEQWKNAKKLKILGHFDYDFPIEHFLHFNRITIKNIRSLSADKSCKFIENFLNRNPPKGSMFTLETDIPLLIDEILPKLPDDWQGGTYLMNLPQYVHSRVYDMKDPKLKLVLKFERDAILGAVCDEQWMEADFRWSVYKCRMDW
ncbi:hypothetical protein B9Z55_018119 [Caenorhabditis nigoni]|uniref:DUF38 domain-containing protein n=1 Tax=Caenorhabditis nigoni TaxID=1611254 RepID=A0A2G5TCP6_9PELO|nr:hypothetical protein B9Z55_018119 [Caenorhabditis nigoni]